MLTKVLSVHVTAEELQHVDQLVSAHPRATRHLVHSLAFREGLRRISDRTVTTVIEAGAITRVMRPRPSSST